MRKESLSPITIVIDIGQTACNKMKCIIIFAFIFKSGLVDNYTLGGSNQMIFVRLCNYIILFLQLVHLFMKSYFHNLFTIFFSSMENCRLYAHDSGKFEDSSCYIMCTHTHFVWIEMKKTAIIIFYNINTALFNKCTQID